ncbi:dachshund homolog 2 isoform X2 [Cimex lectularius]|uniref:SKI/SNO/DAC domain-containing protein n=1 Tax=Cimex lectularius TaxID=79782 RepID=A0A8I6RV00_CIMLE|nr:dachshund homolog 2 isoform X2 [Cimex lectularius]
MENIETGSNSDRSSNMSGSPIPKGSPPAGAAVKQESPHVHHSPPPVSTPSSIAASLNPRHLAAGKQESPHVHHLSLPPPGLGLLGMVPHSPLDLMAVAHHHPPPRSYSSPPPISTSDPTANECKLVDYRGQKVAAFIIAGDTMLCLPQAFELFLKHLVGGLHTVYTKLKRLDIVPLVCNVEQVRILRGLGAIQPGVNRCKLLSCKDFDILYRDCTTARWHLQSSNRIYTRKPGRPPKRAPVGLSLAASHLSQQIKKHRMDNGDYPSSGYENGHISGPRLEKSPLLANGYNHPPTHLNHMQFMQLNHPGSGHTAILNPGLQHHLIKPPPPIEALSRSGIWENCRAAYEDIVKHLERLREERGENERALALDQKQPRDLSLHNGNHYNSSSNGQSPVLNLSKSVGEQSCSDGGQTGPEDEDEEDDNPSDPEDDEEDKDQDLSDTGEGVNSSGAVSPHALNYSAALGTTGGGPSAPTSDPTISSTETLLRNIQGLLKVAADNARQQERQINYEKAELKMDVLREREVKDSLERQLLDEQKVRMVYQKRFRKERKARRRLQDQLEIEMKRRSQLEEALKAAGAPPEALRVLSESCAQSASQTTGGSGGSATAAGGGSGSTSTGNGGGSGGGGSQTTERDRPERPEVAEQATPTNYTTPSTTPRDPPPPQDKPWNYSSIDLINSGAAFWQNYSETLAQELELERKSRQQQAERDKSPLQESRPGYYKNSVLFSSAT